MSKSRHYTLSSIRKEVSDQSAHLWLTFFPSSHSYSKAILFWPCWPKLRVLPQDHKSSPGLRLWGQLKCSGSITHLSWEAEPGHHTVMCSWDGNVTQWAQELVLTLDFGIPGLPVLHVKLFIKNHWLNCICTWQVLTGMQTKPCCWHLELNQTYVSNSAFKTWVSKYIAERFLQRRSIGRGWIIIKERQIHV